MKKFATLLLIAVLAGIPASTACAASATTTPIEVTDAPAFGSVQLVLYSGLWADALPIKIVDAGRWISVPMSCYSTYCRGEVQVEFGDHQLVVFNHDGWVIWKMILRAYGPRQTVRWISVPGVRWFEIGSVIPTCQIGCYNAGVTSGRLFCVPNDPANPPVGGCRLGSGGSSQWWIP